MKRFLSLFAASLLAVSLFPISASSVTANTSTQSSQTAFQEDAFLVYIGTYLEQYPLFEYYRSYDGVYKHEKVYYSGELDDAVSYGDIFTSTEKIRLSLDNTTFYTYAIQSEPVLENIGNCTELMEQESYTVVHSKHIQNSDTIIEPFYDYCQLVLSDSEGEEYRFTADYYGTASEISLKNAAYGDTILFAVYQDMPILPLAEPERGYVSVMGDVNDDSAFSLVDIVFLQKWLLAVPNVELPFWKAADFNADQKLDVFDLCMMKRAYLSQLQAEHCTLTVATEYGGSNYDGEPLESGSFAESFIISEGDIFYETEDGHWLQNEPDSWMYEDRIIQIIDISADTITIIYQDEAGKPLEIPYDTASEIESTFTVYDGINYTYKISFSDYYIGLGS